MAGRRVLRQVEQAVACTMSTLTIRVHDDTHARTKFLAHHRVMTVNELKEQRCTIADSRHDAETRPRALAARGPCASCRHSVPGDE